MENASLVGGREPVGDAGQQLDGLAPTAARCTCPILERAAIDELGDQILATFELPRIDREDLEELPRALLVLRFREQVPASFTTDIGDRRIRFGAPKRPGAMAPTLRTQSKRVGWRRLWHEMTVKFTLLQRPCPATDSSASRCSVVC